MRAIFALLLGAALLQAADANAILIRNVMIHPVSGPDIQNNSLLISNGRIAEIGPKVSGHAARRLLTVKGCNSIRV